MKRLLILLFVFKFNNKIQAHDEENFDLCLVNIPEQKVLQSRFHDIMLDHFYSKACEIRKLEGREVHVLVVLGAVNFALRRYTKGVDRITASFFMQELKYDILSIILEDSPKSLMMLKNIMMKIQNGLCLDHELKIID